MIKLFLKSGLTFEEKTCDKDRCVVGRADDCDVPLTINGVSRQHCEILFSDGQARVNDLGSRNGTLVNGEKIDKEVALSPGDAIRLGEAVFYYAEKPEVLNEPIFLMIINGPGEGKRLDVGSDTIIIGRKDCDFTLDDDEGASSRHAIVELGPSGYVVKDLGSRNGIWLHKNKVQTVNLSEHHVFRIGKTRVFCGSESDLEAVNNAQKRIHREMVLQKLLPTIIGIMVLITIVVVFVFKPEAFHSGKINSLGTNGSFEKSRPQSTLPQAWTLLFGVGLEGQLVKDAFQGELAFRASGDQEHSAEESRLLYEEPVSVGTGVFTLSAKVKTKLNMGIVQLGLLVQGGGQEAMLRGKAVCDKQNYKELSQVFSAPSWAQTVQPCLIFASIDGSVVVDSVELYEEEATFKGAGLAEIGTDATRMLIGSDGRFSYYIGQTEIVRNASLFLPGAAGKSDQTLGYLTSQRVLKAVNAFEADGLIYNFNTNAFSTYTMRIALDKDRWDINYRMTDRKDLSLRFDLPSEYSSLEAFGSTDQKVEVTEKTRTLPFNELCIAGSLRNSLLRKDDKAMLLTLDMVAGTVLESDTGESLFPLRLLNYSPHFLTIVIRELDAAQKSLKDHNYKDALAGAKKIKAGYGGFAAQVKQADRIITNVEKRAKDELKSFADRAKHLDPKNEDHVKKISQFSQDAKAVEARYQGVLDVSIKLETMRKALSTAGRKAQTERLNSAADGLVKKIHEAILKENFVLVDVLIGSLVERYPGTKAYNLLAELQGQVTEQKSLVKKREAYIKARNLEADNFANNKLNDAARKVYEEILARYPKDEGTKFRLKELLEE